MTTVFTESVRCAACGESSEHLFLASTTQFGSEDLDLRPPPLLRSAMFAWIQCCPNCGYCAPDLSELVSEAKEKIKGHEYRAILSDPRLPELARHFQAFGTLTESKSPEVAANAFLHAAWTCDDAGLEEEARRCRRSSAECFERLRPFEDSDEGLAAGAVFVDILRRVREFDRAMALSNELLGYNSVKGIVQCLLEYQQRHINSDDSAAHRLSDVECEP